MRRHALLAAALLAAPWAAAQTSLVQPSASAASRAFGGADPGSCSATPQYPPEAARRGIQGTSQVAFTVDASGRVVDARVEVPSGATPENAALDQAVLAAFSACRFSYAVASGTPPPWIHRIKYIWRLDNANEAKATIEFQDKVRAGLAKLEADARNGDPTAQLELGLQYANHEYRELDDRAASMWLRKAAEAGNADAQVYYGQRLVTGKGVSSDEAAGIAWLRKAAAQGNGAADYGLGLFARAGRGMPASQDEAFRWFLRGAEAGNLHAMNEAADAYAKGLGVARDDAAAAHWNLVASPRSSRAQFRLAIAYRDGIGVPVDYERAAMCVAVLARHGEREPTAVLATIAPHLSPETLARIRVQAETWQPGQPVVPAIPPTRTGP